MNPIQPTAAISGIGIFSPIGNSPREVEASLRAQKDGIARVSKIDTSKFASHIAAEVRGVDFSKELSARELEDFTDPFLRLALVAAKAAMRDAKIETSRRRDDIAMVLATCNAGMTKQELEYRALNGFDEPFSRRDSMQGEFYAIARAFASALNLGGACFVINTACSGSTAAVGLAQTLVRQGKYKTVLAGGADALALANFAGFSALKVVSPEKTAPFSNPAGMNIGEGAAFWIVEESGSAKSRGAKVYGKIIGRATAGDAHHPTQPDPRGDGAFRTMRAALENSGAALEDIGCINAHASGTSANDRAESKAVAKFVGASGVPFTCTKSYHGHCMGATGIIEATCQLLAMNGGFIPPTLRFGELRAGCAVAPVSELREVEYNCFLSANYAFAGNNAAVVVARNGFEKYAPRAEKKLRKVISGLSAVSPLGLGMDANLERLGEGFCAVGGVSRFECAAKAGTVCLPNPRTLDRRIDFSGMNFIGVCSTLACARALESAKLRAARDDSVGLVAAVSRGASRQAHMAGVFSDPQMRGDIACFSNVTPNSTAGWVSKALEIRGANTTFTSGHNCGLQTLEYASMLIDGGDARALAVFAADELSAEQMNAYERIGYLRSGDKFNLRYADEYATFFGEGSCAAVVESLESAQARGAEIFGEILGAASTMDGGDFFDADMASDGLQRAAEAAVSQAGLDFADIDLIVWSPRGSAVDSTAVNVRDRLFGGVPMATTVFNTGYMETASSLFSLACALYSYARGGCLWRQLTGVEGFDGAVFPKNPKHILALANSFTGANYAVVVGR